MASRYAPSHWCQILISTALAAAVGGTAVGGTAVAWGAAVGGTAVAWGGVVGWGAAVVAAAGAQAASTNVAISTKLSKENNFFDISFLQERIFWIICPDTIR